MTYLADMDRYVNEKVCRCSVCGQPTGSYDLRVKRCSLHTHVEHYGLKKLRMLRGKVQSK